MSENALPLPDYDHLPVGSLQHRIRSLTGQELRTLLAYEREHNDRAQVVDMLSNRLHDLEEGESPAPGTQRDEPVEARGSRHGSKVGPSGSIDPSHPPPHGVTGQHGKPKGNVEES